MIKRYTPSGTGMVEWYSGDYVRYDEHQEIMESIGAGGVSGRITKKTIEEHRAEFEKWLSSVGATDLERYMEDGFYIDWDVQLAWTSWKAARGVEQ